MQCTVCSQYMDPITPPSWSGTEEYNFMLMFHRCILHDVCDDRNGQLECYLIFTDLHRIVTFIYVKGSFYVLMVHVSDWTKCVVCTYRVGTVDFSTSNLDVDIYVNAFRRFFRRPTCIKTVEISSSDVEIRNFDALSNVFWRRNCLLGMVALHMIKPFRFTHEYIIIEKTKNKNKNAIISFYYIWLHYITIVVEIN